MSLSSISFASYQNAIASAYSNPSPRTVPSPAITLVRPPDEPSPTAVATGLASLLQNLASNDVSASRQSLDTLSKSVQDADDQSGQFTRLLTRLSSSLGSGDTTGALTQIQSFLLSSGRSTGNSFSATV